MPSGSAKLVELSENHSFYKCIAEGLSRFKHAFQVHSDPSCRYPALGSQLSTHSVSQPTPSTALFQTPISMLVPEALMNLEYECEWNEYRPLGSCFVSFFRLPISSSNKLVF